ncbi:hypothetical protein A2160_04815 [Candidatus Beckwithbacteria bacterium RBG_13_42_9]|uniref:Transcription regulator TrmB N-terminal domain-containing protein n=1 Tax=Candidatus Beckwithbacteria bacterium RBG_13_42_9 TaxID=1797457 RepID=A0A1F5E5S1_9BACT|nr:MAG: hypothetical protein A2160_04815 [Candidatus Beckwithbacteria bacterium RBG_13_42_9]
MVNNQKLTDQLRLFDIDDKGSQIYLLLLQKGVLTPLELSRLSGLNRTSIYRYLEELKNLGLVEEVLDQSTTKARACEPEKLKLLLTQKEAALDKIKQALPDLIDQLSGIEDNTGSATKVVYFRGQSGLKQILWNTLKAKTGVVGYGYLTWNEGVGQEFAEKLRHEYVKRGIFSREISNDADSQKSYTKEKVYLEKYYQARQLPKAILEINHDTYIYNDVFAFYHIYQEELFGVEIHNSEIAKTQKQIFEILWKIAKKGKEKKLKLFLP